MLFLQSTGVLAALACLFFTCTDAAKSSGCGKELASSIKQGGTGDSNKLSIKSSGVSRTYLLHIPEVYTPTNSHGLIFSFHGRSETGAAQESFSQLSDHDNNPNMLVVYPDGVDNQWQGDPAAKANDVQFTLDMINSISSQYCIDSDRIFATGMSNGGGFSGNILACDPVASQKIAAFAPVSGAYYQGMSDANCNAETVPISCNPGRKPIPIQEIHGGADATIPYNGGPRRQRCLPSMPHFITEWSKRNGLGTSNTSVSLYDDNVTRYKFGRDANLQGINMHFRVSGLGHTWPTTKNSYFNATPLIMDFFKKWDLSTTPINNIAGGSTMSTSTSTSKPTTSSATSSKSSSASKTSSTYTSTSTVTSPSCPSANGTTFTDESSSVKYNILCGYDSSSAGIFRKPVYTLGSFWKCISVCSATDGCKHVVYNGVCYMKKGTAGMKNVGGTTLRVAIRD